HQLASNLLHELYQELEKAHQELELQASLDALTQVANRRTFDEYLA
ncbi:MAG: GGDEF domain-containing protein, partial [Okeania sp. SIO2H7]|nr:GGDEF domain-containing protein [Okeania sp. SIO2H7]